MTVRTRIAPSPTGDPHVGTAYIALFNLCFARQHGGQFILRIEDTDRVRSTPESEQMILDSLRWVGLNWDEGPDVGGPHGPYRQSERGAIYAEHAQQLLDKGYAFKCFCTTERLNEVRKQQVEAKQTPGYDGHCLSLSEAEVKQKEAAGEAYVVRMKVPREGTCVVQDTLRGTIAIEWSQVDMQVLMKADGMPTYHLANVVDDHLMQITHVIRGEEWISSAPKHLLLYQYFGWQAPQLCHMPLLRNPDKSKLSKRKNPTSINYYRRMGYLPHALLNYLGRMGWSMPDEREKFTLGEMVAHFDINRVSLGGPIFDVEKLAWLNGQWIRENFNADALADEIQKWAFNREYLMQILPLVQSRIAVFSDIAPLAAFFLAGSVHLTPESFTNKKLSPEEVLKILQFALWQFDVTTKWTRESVHDQLNGLCEKMGFKMRDFMAPFFVAVAGTASSTPVIDSMAIMGSDMTRARLRNAINVLGGVSKKQAKEWEKEYAALNVAKSSEDSE